MADGGMTDRLKLADIIVEREWKPEPEFTLTMAEARALWRELARQYINHENELAIAVVMRLGKFVDRFGEQ